MWPHIAATGAAFLIALAISIVAGLAIGLAARLSRMATEVTEPLLPAANSVPKIALYPSCWARCSAPRAGSVFF